ncbi:ssDNA binding protein [Tothia fuscella]|uniref:SsDNA binding protein n=1 Tax=Tothia fuscella TaxID=1048955 RepID=A0A9P4U375_9PEZI|nr:ssDNA binding protein [Tothia fuscella]
MSSTSVFRSLYRPVFAGASHSFSSTSRASFAKMQVIGRLAAAPELVNTSTGKDLVKYSVASSYGPKDNEKTSWWRVVNFQPAGPQRDYVLGLEKGTLVHLDADAQLQSYTDADGKNRSGLNLIQRDIQVLSRPKNRQPMEEETEERQAASA